MVTDQPTDHVALHPASATSTTATTTTTTLPTPPIAATTIPRRPATTRTTLVAPTNRIAFVGDSLSVNLGDAARAEARTLTPGIDVVSDGISGCGVARSGAYQLGGRVLALSEICADWSTRWAEELERDHPKVVVIQVGRHEVLDRELDGQWSDILQPDYADYVRRELNDAVAIAGNGDRQVVLLTSPYFQSAAGGPEDDPARVQRFNQLLVDVAAGNDHVHIADLGGRASPDGAYADVVDGIRIRKDGVHYSAAGASWAVKWLLPRLAPLVAEVQP